MDNVVPNALQRLRAADIIRMAGLLMASLGQEYCRIGAVHSTKLEGARLTGIVDVTGVPHNREASTTIHTNAEKNVNLEHQHYVVAVELQSTTVWNVSCTCLPKPHVLCQHGAALLYQWLARPTSFVTLPSSTGSEPLEAKDESPARLALLRLNEQKNSAVPLTRPTRATSQIRQSLPSASLVEILGQLGLGELRGIAREYEIAATGLNKPQLLDAIASILKQPEMVRKAAATLDKPQRQLLATISLAGGSISDEDLRGVFERFSFGQLSQLQPMLGTLQSKGLLFHTSISNSPQQLASISNTVLDVGWYVPIEIRTALRVMVPVTNFNVEQGEKSNGDVSQIFQLAPFQLLADLLLVARALDGYPLENFENEKQERSSSIRSLDSYNSGRIAGILPGDGAGTIPPPAGMPSNTLIETLQRLIPRSPAFLRFAVRLLRLADILYKDDTGTPNLRALAGAAHLLLGSSRAEVARDLFELWLTNASYQELFDLQEEGLRLRCRATPLNHILLRPGELEVENSEARQWLIALITQAPLNQWISFPAFARFIYRLNPLFLQKRQRLYSSPHWWIEQEEGQISHPAQLNEWLLAEGRYLTRLVRGPLYWWGASELAISKDDRLQAFRLTSVAGWLLGGTSVDEASDDEEEQTVEAPLLEVLETGEILVTCRATAWSLIELVENFAEIAGVRDGRLCYRLSPRSLSEAMGRGKQPTALLEGLRRLVELEEKPASPLARLLAQLEGWVASYGRIRLYTGVTLLEVADNLVMRELTTTTSLDEQVVQTIHPTLMILKKSGAERLIEDLKKRGQAPLLHEEGDYGTE